MPTVRADLVEPEAGPLPKLGRLRDARVPQRGTPDVQPHLLSELAHNPEHAARFERAVSILPALAARLEQRPAAAPRGTRKPSTISCAEGYD
jgi:hypothetical protein